MIVLVVGAPERDIRPQVVTFDNARKAVLVQQRSGDDARALLSAFAPEVATWHPLLLVCGGADDLHGAPLELARAIIDSTVKAVGALTRCTVLDGGTASGVMQLTGAARAEDPAALPVLIGIAPAGKVAYPGAASPNGTPLDPNHTHFVLAHSAQWGGETELMFAVADELAAMMPAADRRTRRRTAGRNS